MISDLSAAEIAEVDRLSPAFKRYRAQHSTPRERPKNKNDFALMQSFLRYRRQSLWCESVANVMLNKVKSEGICDQWSASAVAILREGADFLEQEKDVDFAIFALGKLGAQELNLSSDVDLLFVGSSVDKSPTKFLRQFQRLFTEITHEGFCFRVDLDLRPGGTQGPIVPTVSQLEDYYMNYGETWERLAFTRLLPIWGCQEITNQVVTFFSKFAFRKHLDFTLFSDLLSLRQKIHSHYWSQDRSKFDLKHGLGGIRDTELFAHALQVIHGGKDPQIRSRSTSKAFDFYRDKKILPGNDAVFLKDHYWNLRCLENFIQAVNDEQIYEISWNVTSPTFIKDALKRLPGQLHACDQLVGGLIGQVDPGTKSVPAGDANQRIWLKSCGIPETTIDEFWPELITKEAQSYHKERDEEVRLQFLYAFVTALKTSVDPDLGFKSLLDFIRSVKAKATFFTLLCRQPLLIEELALLFSTSPLLAKTICQRPELLDSFVYRATESSAATQEEFLENLVERKLLNQILAGTDFLKSLDVSQLVKSVSLTADQICQDLLANLKDEYPSTLSVVAMGKWGGEELGILSDLDLVLVTDGLPTQDDHKVARRFSSRLSEAHRGGNIYNIDLRLRPGGSQSLIISPQSQVKEFLETTAEPWERQAYLRSRFLHAGASLAAAAVSKSLTDSDLRVLAEIREQLMKKAKSETDLKYSAGGFIDVEFSVQTYFLSQQIVPSSANTFEMLGQVAKHDVRLRGACTELQTGYLFLRRCEQLFRLLSSLQSSSFLDQIEVVNKMARHYGENTLDFTNRIKSVLAHNAQFLKDLDPCQRQS